MRESRSPVAALFYRQLYMTDWDEANEENKKSKKCQGKGFIFGKNYIIKEGSCEYEPHEYGIKLKLHSKVKPNQINKV